MSMLLATPLPLPPLPPAERTIVLVFNTPAWLQVILGIVLVIIGLVAILTILIQVLVIRTKP